MEARSQASSQQTLWKDVSSPLKYLTPAVILQFSPSLLRVFVNAETVLSFACAHAAKWKA